ncbi:MAG: spondin domain-containing protein [Planctomycetota bacterium]
MLNRTTLTACAIAALASMSHAQTISITFENLLPSGGTALTPVFVGLDDGTFNLFNPGGNASAGLELVAEVGQTGTLISEFQLASPSGVADTGFGPGGPILGGQSATVDLNAGDATVNRFLSFASMIVPTNDLFIGTPNAIEVFDAGGNFNGPITFEILGSQVWDAGTEVNNADDGAAFLQGIDGGLGTPQNGSIALFFDDPNASSYLDSLIGRTTAPGFDIASTFTSSTAIARVTIVPTPGAIALLPIAGAVSLRRRRA